MKSALKWLVVAYVTAGMLRFAIGYVQDPRNLNPATHALHAQSRPNPIGEVILWPVFVFKPDWVDPAYRAARLR